MEKTYLYYGTEENGFEPEVIGEFETKEQAKEEMVRRLIEVDGVDKDDIDAEDYDFDGFDCQDYRIVYLIGSKDECESQLEELREEFEEMFD